MNPQPLTRLQTKLKQYPNLTFWILFFFLNILFFLPLYAINRGGSTFWPSAPGEVGDGSLRWFILKLFVIRQNADFFRLSIDWVLLVAVWVWLRPLRHPLTRKLLTAFFIFAIIYNSYDTAMFAIYNDYPNFYDDILLIISGIDGLTRFIGIPYYVYGLILIGIILFFMVCVRLIRQLTDEQRLKQLNWASHVFLLLIVGYSLAMIWEYSDYIDHPRIAAGSVIAKVRRNAQQSLSTYRNRQLVLNSREALANAYDYTHFSLNQKPDVYMLVIESYGDAIYQSTELRDPYLALANQLDNKLQESGWQTASIRSQAPIRGGKSWLAYTSLLFGLRIDDEAQYDVLLDEFSESVYPDLGHYFKSQGYDYQRITPLLVTLERDVVGWEKTRRFFGYDTWLFLNNMNYAGPVYGWGPSPPDQYTISFMREEAETKRPNNPHLYFYITHNSHLPWADTPTVVQDWQSLATAPPAPPVAYDPNHESQEAYLQSIFYQLEMVTQVILDGPADALYVVLGDHQPPLLAFSDYEGTATPLHIFSKNQALIDSFVNQGFAAGLTLGEGSIKHEGFYSLFMQMLLHNYGGYDLDELPPIRPDGLDLETLVRD